MLQKRKKQMLQAEAIKLFFLLFHLIIYTKGAKFYLIKNVKCLKHKVNFVTTY